ncbi:hypothetical protein O181_062479 [Austropuccinia psidii MF-1]|uniref:Uncharacterized protein n=1 Tax=Austropuccinia psidii MF-1 TaxID=1389203 RepID=A0A9Q3EK70_9BASI|nr:hypothetical protein [Austropuccinia psidii MF-1]
MALGRGAVSTRIDGLFDNCVILFSRKLILAALLRHSCLLADGIRQLQAKLHCSAPRCSAGPLKMLDQEAV